MTDTIDTSAPQHQAASGSIELPIVDLTAPNADRDYIEKKREYGFVAVVNHGIDPGLVQAAFEATRRVGNLPPDVLLCYHHRNDPATASLAGYFGYGEEKAKEHRGGWDLKHFWHVYRIGHRTRTPFPAEVPEFEPAMRALLAALDVLQYRSAAAFTHYSGVQLPVPMEQALIGGDTLLRALHYPNVAQLCRLAEHAYRRGLLDTLPSEDELRGHANIAMRATPHEDINFTTILRSVDGLELLMRDGQWVAVEAPPEAFIMQTGDMEQMASFGAFPSMTHRVVNTDDPDAERINIPCFGHPRPDVALVTKATLRERTGWDFARCSDDTLRRMAARGTASRKLRNFLLSDVSPKVADQLEKLGLYGRLLDTGTDVLCGAGEYLTLRLREIGIIKDDAPASSGTP